MCTRINWSWVITRDILLVRYWTANDELPHEWPAVYQFCSGVMGWQLDNNHQIYLSYILLSGKSCIMYYSLITIRWADQGNAIWKSDIPWYNMICYYCLWVSFCTSLVSVDSHFVHTCWYNIHIQQRVWFTLAVNNTVTHSGRVRSLT